MSGSNTQPLTPTIRDAEGRTVTPVYTDTWTAVTENDNKRHQSLCGTTQIEPIGEENWRITISGLVVKSQARKLVEMRPAGNTLTIVTDIRTFTDVDFDRFRLERTDEQNVYEGRAPSDTAQSRVSEPLLSFTLQTQEDTNG